MVAVDKHGFFIMRPEIGSTYLSPDGYELTVAASWERGVVFEGGKITARATDLVNYFTPIQGAQPCAY